MVLMGSTLGERRPLGVFGILIQHWQGFMPIFLANVSISNNSDLDTDSRILPS